MSISSRFLGQEDRSTRRLAHRLVEAQLSHGKVRRFCMQVFFGIPGSAQLTPLTLPQGLKAACDNSRLLQRLEEHLAQEADDEEIARIRSCLSLLALMRNREPL